MIEYTRKRSSFHIKFILFATLLICSLFTLFLGDTPWDIVWTDALHRLPFLNFNGTPASTAFEWNPLLD